VELRSNHCGSALFAIAPISAGSVIYDANKSPATLLHFSSKDVETWSPEKIRHFATYSWQVGPDLWSGPLSEEYRQVDYVNFMNHSCDPVAWFDGYERLTARKDIQPGQEITFDYGTSDVFISSLIHGCLCETELCRKRVSPWDYRLPSLQARYGNHFMPYINNLISRLPKLELGTGKFSTLHKNIELKPSPLGGLGLFATDFIPKGSITWWEEQPIPRYFTLEELERLPDDPEKELYLHFGYQVDDNLFSTIHNPQELQEDAGHFMNHSCDPTTWFLGDYLMEARRDIRAGEEITFDYGTTESHFESFPKCLCGSPSCRGKVSPNDYVQLQNVYKNRIAPYLLSRQRNNGINVLVSLCD